MLPARTIRSLFAPHGRMMVRFDRASGFEVGVEAENVDADRLKEELADVFAFAILLAEKHGFDITQIVLDKIRKNNEKYPVSKSKGTAKKYTEL